MRRSAGLPRRPPSSRAPVWARSVIPGIRTSNPGRDGILASLPRPSTTPGRATRDARRSWLGCVCVHTCMCCGVGVVACRGDLSCSAGSQVRTGFTRGTCDAAQHTCADTCACAHTHTHICAGRTAGCRYPGNLRRLAGRYLRRYLRNKT